MPTNSRPSHIRPAQPPDGETNPSSSSTSRHDRPDRGGQHHYHRQSQP